jgi:hypothetical protein
VGSGPRPGRLNGYQWTAHERLTGGLLSPMSALEHYGLKSAMALSPRSANAHEPTSTYGLSNERGRLLKRPPIQTWARLSTYFLPCSSM